MFRCARSARRALIALAVLWASACGEDPETSLQRSRFLFQKQKYEEAKQAALEGADNADGQMRCELLIAAAENTYKIYQATGNKGQLNEMLQILQKTISEKIVFDGRPYQLASLAFHETGKMQKAIGYLKKAEVASTTDADKAMYHIMILDLFREKKHWSQLYSEAGIFLKEHENASRQRYVESMRDMAYEKMQVENQSDGR